LRSRLAATGDLRRGGQVSLRRRPQRTQRDDGERNCQAAFVVHTKLGPGLLESVYEVALAYELKNRGLTAERQKSMPILYDNIRFDEAFRSDLVVNGKVFAELKSVEATGPVHAKQLLTQRRLSGLKLRLLINFARNAPEKWHQAHN
jgi:GxxExxY protein